MKNAKAGDKFRGKRGSIYTSDIRTVKHIGDNWVLYDFKGTEECVGRDRFETEFELVPDFFEEGKTYTRVVNGAVENVYIESVREDDVGLVAFGNVVTAKGERWRVLRSLAWNYGKWDQK